MSNNRTVSPIPLDMFQTETKVFAITVKDADGNPVGLAGKTLRFVVQDENNPPNGVFDVENANITKSGGSNEIANVTVDALQSTAASADYLWRLWSVSDDSLLAHGPFAIRTAVKDVL